MTQSKSPPLPPHLDLLDGDTTKATSYCTYCPKMCRFSCPAAEAESRETVTPWGMMRLLELVRRGAIQPSEEVAEIFYHCMGCRRCQTWCGHDNDVPHAMWQGREWMAELGYVPAIMQGFAGFFVDEKAPFNHFDPLDEAMANGVFDPASAVIYWPDCETRKHNPQLINRAGQLLARLEGHKVRLQTRRDTDSSLEHADLQSPTQKDAACCGFPLLSAGAQTEYQAYREALIAEFSETRLIITDCAAFAALHRDDTSWGTSSPLQVMHTMEYLDDKLEGLEVPQPQDLSKLKLHDSCFVGRQLHLYEATRRVLSRLSLGQGPQEFYINREEAPCCGGPSHYHVVAPQASERCAKSRLTEMENEGGEGIVCGSPTCRKAFSRVASEELRDHILDLLEIACRAFAL